MTEAYPYPLPDEESKERQSLEDALKRYHASDGALGLPQKGPDNRWHDTAHSPPPRMSSGYATPPRPDAPAPEPDKGMSMADYLAGRTPPARLGTAPSRGKGKRR